jgi:hypothetical protein
VEHFTEMMAGRAPKYSDEFEESYLERQVFIPVFLCFLRKSDRLTLFYEKV